MDTAAADKKTKDEEEKENAKKKNVEKAKLLKGPEKEKKKTGAATKVDFVARNREAASRQGKIQRKPKQSNEADTSSSSKPGEPKKTNEPNKPKGTDGGSSKVVSRKIENRNPTKLPTDVARPLREQTSKVASDRPQSSTAKASKKPLNLQKWRPQTSRANRSKLQVEAKASRTLNEDQSDLVTGLIQRNLHHLLSQIFLQQSDITLAGCRRVCSSWWQYLRNIFWRDPVVRRQLEARLVQRWRGGLCTRVEVVVMGMSCKLKCAENFRRCKCLEKLNCAISGNAVIIEFGGTQYREVRKVESNESGRSKSNWGKLPFSSSSHTFPSEQFQVTLHLGLGLHLETSTWLSSPVFMEVPGSGRSSLRIEARGWIVQPAPGKDGELIVKGEEGLVESRVTLPSPGGTVERLQESGGLVACLAAGRVYVYNLESLASGGRHSALLFSSREFKKDEPSVHFFHLTPSSLLLVAGTRIELVDFWKFTWQSSTRDFVL